MTRPGVKTTVIAAALAGGAVVAAAAVVSGIVPMQAHGGHGLEPVWTEIPWPHLIDQFGAGRAFVCGAADCGTQIMVQIRPKIGFCNCSTGVSDDNELERVADTDLVSSTVTPLGPSHPVKVGWMHGLSRPYLITTEQAGGRLISIAFNDECDAVVALAQLGTADPAIVEPAVLAFLNTRPMVLWTKKELGLEYMAREW